MFEIERLVLGLVNILIFSQKLLQVIRKICLFICIEGLQ